MDIVKNKIKLYLDIIPKFEEYVEKISTTHKTMYSQVADSKYMLASARSQIKTLYTADFSSTGGIFKTVGTINTINGNLFKVYDMINIDMSDIPTEMSNTFILNMSDGLKKIIVKYSILLEDSKKYDSQLIHVALDIIKNDTVDNVNKWFEKYPTAISLYAHFIQNKLNESNPASGEYVKILEYVETAKYKLLASSSGAGMTDMSQTLKKNKNPTVSTTQGVWLQRFGLIPMWQHLDETQVLQQALNIIYYSDEKTRNPGRMYGGGFSPDKLKKLSNQFSEKRKGLFVIVSVSSNQIEYDFRPLIHRKTVDKLNIPENSGLSSDILFKFDNIKSIQTDHPGTEHKLLEMGDIKSDSWIILRTMNGSHFDIMGLDKENMSVNKAYIDKLKRGPSALIDSYQRICSRQFYKYVKTPQEIVLDGENTPLLQIATKVMRASKAYVDDMLSSNFPANLYDLSEIIASDGIEEITSKVLLQSYAEFIGDAQDAKGSQITSELSSTFLNSSNNVIQGYVKSIKESFAKSGLTEFMFKEKTKHALTIHIRSKLNDIIREASEKAFDPRRDLYENLLVKKKILNTEL